jgi:hypothetical protein
MPEDNQRNILFFEAPTMKSLFESMDTWQKENGKRFLSASIHQDNNLYCCIALTNPMEVVIVNGIGSLQAGVWNERLMVTS